MKLSCISYSYHRSFANGSMTMESWIRECGRLKLEGVELLDMHFPETSPSYLAGIKKLCAEQFLTIAMLSASGHFTMTDDAERAAQVAEMKNWIDVAAYMGAPCVRFFIGSPEEIVSGGAARNAKVIAAVREFCDYAGERGIFMAMENHGACSADFILQLLLDVNHPWFKLNLDIGNFPVAATPSEEAYRSIERCLPFAIIMHGKFYQTDVNGEALDYDWDRILKMVYAAGFNGFISVEYEGESADEVGQMEKIVGNLRKRLAGNRK